MTLSTHRRPILLLLVLTMAVTLLVSCNRREQSDDVTTGESFVPETSIGAQLIAAGNQNAMILDEGWHLKPDPDVKGITDKWYASSAVQGQEINVPCSLLDIGDLSAQGWFNISFRSALEVYSNDRVWLELTGAGYQTTVYLNGKEVGGHVGEHGRFALDVTDAIKHDGDNLLYICARVPTSDKPIDGYTSDRLPNSTSARIASPVYLYVRPDVSVKELFVRPDTKDGSVVVEATVQNASGEAANATLSLKIGENGKSFISDRVSQTITAPVGESVHTLTLTVPDFRYWSTETPVLYTVSAALTTDDGRVDDALQVRTGFKDLRVDDKGYFLLNGERIYIKSTHASLHLPGTVATAEDMDRYYEQLLYLKSCGFNTIRYIMNAPLPEILQMCDEIGLMVYSEHSMSWQKTDCDRTSEFFTASVLDILYRDRNHVSLSIFGMLNETYNKDDTKKLFEAGVAALPAAREAAPDLLFLLSSGRWDGRADIASASNPGSSEWDAWMGDEGEGAPVVTSNVWSLMSGMGDIHYYPAHPLGQTVKNNIEQAGSRKRAVFLSEAGVVSQQNVIGDMLYLTGEDGLHYGFPLQIIQQQAAAFRGFYEDYGLDRIWATPESALVETQVYQTKQRALQLTMIRRVAGYNGYSLTMAFDAGGMAEGVLGMGNDIKPEITELLQNALSDLRFCVSLRNSHLLAGQGADLEVRISDLDVLKEGKKYDVVIRITGADRVVWTKTVSVIGGDDVITVLNESIPTDGWTSGKYTVGCEMLQGANPTCGVAEFYVTNPKEIEAIDGVLYGIGLSNTLSKVLGDMGAELVTDFDLAQLGKGDVLFVGDKSLSDEQLEEIWVAASRGAHAVFLSPKALQSGATYRLPFDTPVTLSTYGEWLYRYDRIVFRTAATEALPGNCIWDDACYGAIYSASLFTTASLPTDISIAAFMTGNTGGNDPFSAGFQLGTYAMGEGHITLNTTALIEGCSSAVGKRLLSNLYHYEEDPETATGPRYGFDKDGAKKIVSYNSKGIAVDGVIGEEEWGNPFIKDMTYESAMANEEDLYIASGDACASSADYYMAYDEAYIYYAAVIRDLPPPAEANGANWANFCVMFTRYTPGTVAPHIVYEGETYEQYVMNRYTLRADGKITVQQQSLGIPITPQQESDYKATYDADARVLTLEIRIPMNQTNLTLAAGEQVAVSCFTRFSMVNGNAKTGTRLQCGAGCSSLTGAGKTPMATGAMVLALGAKK